MKKTFFPHFCYSDFALLKKLVYVLSQEQLLFVHWRVFHDFVLHISFFFVYAKKKFTNATPKLFISLWLSLWLSIVAHRFATLRKNKVKKLLQLKNLVLNPLLQVFQ